jgi:hypothetical protein
LCILSAPLTENKLTATRILNTGRNATCSDADFKKITAQECRRQVSGITFFERGQNVTGVSAVVVGRFCITSAHLSSKRTEGKNLIWIITRYSFLLSGEIFFGYQGMHCFIAVVNPTLG